MRPILMAGAAYVPPALSFSPVPDFYTVSHRSNVSFTITASQPVAWNWSASGDLPTSNVPNGSTASSITFSLSNLGSEDKVANVSVSVGGDTWNIEMTAIGSHLA